MTRSWQELIEAADVNGLLRVVHALCGERAWDEVLELADRCEDAIERGKQLWPIAAHVDYRVALEAPAEIAASVLVPDVARFSLGPLTEVAASTHTWDQLAPHIDAPQNAAYVAQERVLRGEDLTGDDRAHAEVLELPLRIEPWEPAYALATYKADHVEVAEPWEPRAALRYEEPRDVSLVDDPELEETLLALVTPWTAESNGAARVAIVEGDAASAAAPLTLGRFRMGSMDLQETLRALGWAAASGGAHGRRRGAALGRSLTWYTLSVLAGTPWPVDPAELHAALDDLRFFRWDEGEPEEGWVLRVAVEHARDGWAAAIGATDVLDDLSGEPA